jgi:hypothetical protein
MSHRNFTSSYNYYPSEDALDAPQHRYGGADGDQPGVTTTVTTTTPTPAVEKVVPPEQAVSPDGQCNIPCWTRAHPATITLMVIFAAMVITMIILLWTSDLQINQYVDTALLGVIFLLGGVLWYKLCPCDAGTGEGGSCYPPAGKCMSV